MFIRYIISLVCVLVACFVAEAQSRFFPEVSGQDSTLSVSLITCAPGSEVYELEGHSALRVCNSEFDVVVNWGLFDFNSPNFVYRFLKGETDYCVGVCPTYFFVRAYEAEGRRVTEQKLNLTQRQKIKLVWLLNENLRPENRVYRYNYVKDNCATRPLAIIEKATKQSTYLDSAAAVFADGVSFRKVMYHYHVNYPWYQLGIDLALGCGVDYPISVRATAFAPVVLEQLASRAKVYSDSLKCFVPLVDETIILSDGDVEGVVKASTTWWLTPMAIAVFLLIVALILSWRDIRVGHVCRWFDAVLFGLCGIEGCILAFLVFVSVHEATSPNVVVLWLNPLSLIVPCLIWIKRCRGVLVWYQILNVAAIMTCAMCGLAGLQVFNIAFWPLMLAEVIRALNYIYINREVVKRK